MADLSAATAIKQVPSVNVTKRDLLQPIADGGELRHVVGTHVGRGPSPDKPFVPCGERVGWFSPCHDSQSDIFGCGRHGPAPANLAPPPYAFASDTKIRIG